MGLKAHFATLFEWDYKIDKEIDNPFTVSLTATITTPSNKEIIIPSFYRQNGCWSVRFLPSEAGLHKVVTKSNISLLNGLQNTLEVTESSKSYPKVLSVAPTKQYLIDQDGKPFLWLSDTWWMALSSRLDFETFKELVKKRKEQGFNVIQLVAGLFPDMDSFDTRGANKAGFAWSDGYEAINPAYFDEADKKILYLLEEGFTLCIVGSWGYYLKKMGLEKMQQHWRYIIARWGAYPIVWCLAGEATMPYYLSSNRGQEMQELREGWEKIAKYVRSIKPSHSLLTLHPMECSLQEINEELIDFNLLQASHFGLESVKKGVSLLSKCKGQMPTILDEINYEGILRNTHDAVQRLGFWSSILSGSCGFGYGANGIWQINKLNEPFGASPSGANWGNTPLKRAIDFEGAKQIAKAKEFLQQFAWHNLEPMRESLEPKVQDDPTAPYVAGIGKEFRVAYLYNPIAPWDTHYIFTNLEPNAAYEIYFWDPQNFIEYPKALDVASGDGKLQMPLPPSLDDWVMVIVKSNKSAIKSENRLKDEFAKRIKGSLKSLFKSIKARLRNDFY